MAEVARTATQGTWKRLRDPKKRGAWLSTARVYRSREPAKRAWFAAEMTLVISTALMKLPATALPASMKTMVNGLVAVVFSDRFG